MLTDFEKDVIKMMLDRDDPILAGLREQVAHLDVASRSSSRYGFYTRFVVTPINPVNKNLNIEIVDVSARVPGMHLDVGFVLYVRKGLLACLECHTQGDEEIPTDTDFDSFSLYKWSQQ